MVVFVAVLAQGLKSSFIDSFDKTVQADYIISATNFMTIPSDTAERVAAVPAIETAVSLDAQQVQAKGGSLAVVWGIDPFAIERVWSFDWIEGSDAVLGKLGTDGAIVEEQTASSLGVGMGDALPITTVEGKKATLKVMGVYRDPMMLNGITVGTAGYDALFSEAAGVHGGRQGDRRAATSRRRRRRSRRLWPTRRPSASRPRPSTRRPQSIW